MSRVIAPPAPASPNIARPYGVLPGIGLCLALGLAAQHLSGIGWLQAHGLGALTVAIVLGMMAANVLPERAEGAVAGFAGEGVGFTRQTLLRLGVVLYGLRLTLQDVGSIGIGGIALDACVIASTFGLACVLGRKLGIESRTAMLIGAGSAICGAAAVMATEPVVRARAEQTAVAVATVVLFGTIAIFVYPWLYTLNLHWHVLPEGTRAFGIFAGSTIHEVAQVLAAARTVSPDAADTAVVTKMVRVMMLAPFLMALSAWISMRASSGRGSEVSDSVRSGPSVSASASAVAIPWFAFGFIGTVLLRSTGWFSGGLLEVMSALDTLLLSTAMAALGFSTRLDMVRKAGLKPVLLAACLAVWLVAGGALFNRWV